MSAVLCSLCSASIRLRSIFPLLNNSVNVDGSLHRILSPSDNSGLPMMGSCDYHHYPILVEQITHRSQLECNNLGISASTWTWKDVLDRLLNLIIDPITNALMGSKLNPFADLAKHCCHLLARVIAELVYQCSSSEVSF